MGGIKMGGVRRRGIWKLGAEVGIASEEVGDAQCSRYVAAARPDEMFEVTGRIGFRIETMCRIDEGGALRVASSDCEELAENQMTATARSRAGKFGERGGGQAATDGFIDLCYASGQPRAFPLGGGGKAFGDEVPKRGHFFGRSRQREGRRKGE